MATKKELYDHLMKLQEENHRLRTANADYVRVLHSIYSQTRGVLGIEAAIQARHEEKLREQQSQTS